MNGARKSKMKTGIMSPQDIPTVEGMESVCEKLQEWLKRNKKAYSIQRLMVDAFDRKEEDVLGAFMDWPHREDTVLYTRIKRCLQKLQREKKVLSKKVGKPVLYWWADHSSKHTSVNL
jgi:hypothetical protein